MSRQVTDFIQRFWLAPAVTVDPVLSSNQLRSQLHQTAAIAASMAEFGWTVACLLGEDGDLSADNGRVLAAMQLGLTEAPVIVLGHLTDAQRRAHSNADSKLA
jgi:ParB-like chromosome segregation protein Spo0J